MKLELSRHFSKNIHQISCKSVRWSRVFLCRQTDIWAGMTKLIVAFRNFVNAPPPPPPKKKASQKDNTSPSRPQLMFVTSLVSLFIIWTKRIFLSCCNSRLKSGNACYHSVQNLLSSSFLSKNLKIRIYRNIILPVVLYGFETWSPTLWEERRLRVFENRVFWRTFGSKRDEVTGGVEKTT